MKYFLLFLLPMLANAAPVFTTVSYDRDEFFYLGLKKEDKGVNTDSSIAIVTNKDFSHELIPLAPENASRDVVGIIPEEKKIFVLTMRTGEQGDNPLLSAYDRNSKKWRDIGSVNCPIFTKIGFSAKSLTFYCEYLTKRGKSKTRKMSLNLGNEHIHRKGSMRFPEFLIRYRKTDISLEGSALSWSRLRIKVDSTSKVIEASEIYPAPAPLPAATSQPPSITEEQKK